MKNIIKFVSIFGILAILLIGYSGSANAVSPFSIIDEDIDTNATGIATNAGNISTNAAISASGISTNTGNITTNTGNISTNTGNISANTGNISTNIGNISANTGDIFDQDIRITNNDMRSTDNADRIEILEGGGSGGGGGTGGGERPTFDVICSGSPSALKDTDLTPGSIYKLTGMCDGPINISEPAGHYDFIGDDSGVKDDGIILPFGETSFFVVGIAGPVSVRFDNLKISGENYTSKSDGVYVTTVFARNSTVELFNVDVVGGDSGVTADGAFISIGGDSIGGDVNVTDFREDGLGARNNGTILVTHFINVTGAFGEPGDISEALVAYRNGVIDIRQGGRFTPGTGVEPNNDYFSISAGAFDNGTVRIRNSGTDTVTLTGNIQATRSSAIRIQTGTITGAIDVSFQSHMRVENVDHSGGHIDIIHGSGFKAEKDSNLIGDSLDSIFVAGASTMVLDDITMGIGTGIIEVLHYGLLKFDDDNNLNGRIIECDNPDQSIALEPGRGNIGIGEGSCIIPPIP